MDKDKQAHERWRDASLMRRFLDRCRLYNIVLYDDLIQNGEPIDMADRNATPHYEWSNPKSFTEHGKTLYVTKNIIGMWKRKKEEQRIKAPIIPDDASTYTISFDGKTTAAIRCDADAATIKAALELVGLLDITVSGNMKTTIKLKFGGKYAYKHQMAVVVDSSGLRKGLNPLAIPPKVERIVPKDNYCIVQQEWGKKLCALLKQDRANPDLRIPAIPFFFLPNRELKENGIEIQGTRDSVRQIIPLRQGKGNTK